MNISTIEERLRAEHDLPSDFYFWQWECFPKPPAIKCLYVQFTGSRCPLVTRGKRKGKPNYRKGTDKQIFVVSTSEAETWESEYEQNTGNCRQCRGDGKEVKSIDCVNNVTTYRPCSTCRGSGNPLTEQERTNERG